MAIALVSNVAKTTGGTSASIDTTGANFIIIVAGYTNAGGLTTFSDNKSNAWTSFQVKDNTGGIIIYYCLVPTVGAGHTFTSASGLPSYCVAAFSGVATEFAIGKSRGIDGATGTSATPGSITPSIDNCLVIAGLGYRDTTTVSVNDGFSIANQNPFIGGTAVGSALAYKIQTTAGAANPTLSWTNSVVYSAVSVVISPPVSAGPGGGGGSFTFIG